MDCSAAHGWLYGESCAVIRGIRAGMIRFPEFFVAAAMLNADKAGIRPPLKLRFQI